MKQIEVEGGEIAIRNSHGDIAIIPKKDKNKIESLIKDGCGDCIDSFVETLPVMSNYASDGSLYPTGSKIRYKDEDGKTSYIDIDSPEYREMYSKGQIATYDENNELFIVPPLDETEIKEEAPRWLKLKDKIAKEYTKDRFIDEALPNFSRRIGVSANNLNSNSLDLYNKYLNDKVVKELLSSNPRKGKSTENNLEWYNSFSPKERELIQGSRYSKKFLPAERAYNQYVGNQAKEEGIISNFSSAENIKRTGQGLSERGRLFPNAENDIESWVNPLVIVGDMAKGLSEVPMDIKEGNYGKAAFSVASPLLVGAVGGMGAKTTGQFLNNSFNPLAGTGDLVKKGVKATNVGKSLKRGVNKIKLDDEWFEGIKNLSLNYNDIGFTNRNKLQDVTNQFKTLSSVITSPRTVKKAAGLSLNDIKGLKGGIESNTFKELNLTPKEYIDKLYYTNKRVEKLIPASKNIDKSSIRTRYPEDVSKSTISELVNERFKQVEGVILNNKNKELAKDFGNWEVNSWLNKLEKIDNPILKKIAEESPQYTDEIIKHLKNPTISDDMFVNNLVKQANTFRRSLSKDVDPTELLKLKGSSFGYGNKYTIDVEGRSKSGNYGSYDYKFQPNEEFTKYIEELPLDKKWSNRENINYGSGISNGIGLMRTPTENYLNFLNKRNTRSKNLNPYIESTSFQHRKLVYKDNIPTKLFDIQPHRVFNTKDPGKILEGFDVTKIDLKKDETIFTKGYQNGGRIKKPKKLVKTKNK